MNLQVLIVGPKWGGCGGVDGGGAGGGSTNGRAGDSVLNSRTLAG